MGTPRFIRGHDVTLDGDLVLLRGLRYTVEAMIGRMSRLEVTDERELGEVNFRCDFRGEQLKAVSELLPGAAERPCLVIVTRKPSDVLRTTQFCHTISG